MTFPAKIPVHHLNGKVTGEPAYYRGFSLWSAPDRGAFVFDANGSSQGTTSYYLNIGLPAPMPSFEIRSYGYRRINSPGEGGITAGFPPFDKRFITRGDDLTFIRRVLAPAVVEMFASSNWRNYSALTPDIGRDTVIFFGTNSVSMHGDAYEYHPAADFLIDFLYLLPSDIWPTPQDGTR
jgi:hypothetical protein